MATVTGGGFTNVVNVGSNDANGIATALAANLSAALGAGTFTRTAPNNSPSVGGGVPTIFTSGSYTLAPANLGLVVQDGLSATVTGSGGINEGILIGNSSVTFNTNGGSGVLVSGDLAQTVNTGTAGFGAFAIYTGNGNDTINAVSGVNTVSAGAGSNIINTGGAADVVISQGNDTITGSSALAGFADTVFGGGSGTTTVITETTKNLVFNGGAGTTFINGGSGSDTVNLVSSNNSVQGGTGGNSRLSTGFSGSSTIIGGGNGDILVANGTGSNTLQAGAGNETLTGAGASGGETFITGPGNTFITGSSGNDTIFAGAGSSTVDGGPGADLFDIVSGKAGGSVIINGFRPSENDKITLQGYAAGEVAKDLGNASVVPQTAAVIGSTTITLSDNTKITFNGVTNLNSGNFS